MTDVRITATYRLASHLPLERAAQILAGEQSSGTFTRVALESDDLLREHGAVVEDIVLDEEPLESLRGAWNPAGAPLQSGIVRIAFPAQNLGPSVASLLTTVAGNLYEIRELAAVKLLDVELPATFAGRYSGPVQGIAGTRRATGNESGVLIGTIVKPSIGLSVDQLTVLVRELAGAGIDFIKDDELNTDPPFAPLHERIRRVLQVIREVADQTGKKTMYSVNITGDMDSMKRAVELVEQEQGSAVMVAIPAVGFSALAELRQHTDLVIHGHRAGFGALDRNANLGISFRAFAKLVAVCGADHLHVGGVNGKFWESNRQVVESVQAMREVVPFGEQMLPVLSSAQTAATAAATYELLPYRDLLVLAGGGIHAHPGGVADGVASMREAWQAVVAGEDPNVIADPGSALDVALSTFGR